MHPRPLRPRPLNLIVLLLTMASPTENETWLIETGHAIVGKKGRYEIDDWETLVYCLWVADYGMRNAGDLAAAADVYSGFQTDACRIAQELSVEVTLSAFSLSKGDLQQQYFDRFEAICDEIKRANPSDQV